MLKSTLIPQILLIGGLAMIIVTSSMLPLAHASVADVSSGIIRVGATPFGIAYDSTNGDLYVANFGSNTVSVINGKTESLISTIAVGTQPYFLAFDQDNHDVY
ncbi:MAG: YncE family protein, partial [Nitrososphaerales archaeon]